jgi:hypothetical protein
MLFVMEKPLIRRSSARLQKSVLENFDRLTLSRSINIGKNLDRSNLTFDRSTFQDIRISEYFSLKFCHFSLNVLQNTKTQKLVKTSENNEAKGLTNVNLGVQIYNIWHSSIKIIKGTKNSKIKIKGKKSIFFLFNFLIFYINRNTKKRKNF